MRLLVRVGSYVGSGNGPLHGLRVRFQHLLVVRSLLSMRLKQFLLLLRGTKLVEAGLRRDQRLCLVEGWLLRVRLLGVVGRVDRDLLLQLVEELSRGMSSWYNCRPRLFQFESTGLLLRELLVEGLHFLDGALR